MADETPQEPVATAEPVVAPVVSEVPVEDVPVETLTDQAPVATVAPPIFNPSPDEPVVYIDGLVLTSSVQQLHEDLTMTVHPAGAAVPESIPQDGVLALLIAGAIAVPPPPEPPVVVDAEVPAVGGEVDPETVPVIEEPTPLVVPAAEGTVA